MKDNHYNEDKQDIRELLTQFLNLKAGRSHRFLDEDSFEKIIDYYDDTEDISRAMEAAEIAVEQFPYSSSLLIKKADLLIASRQYQAALDLLEQVEVLDHRDINLYILKTDALLALDQQERAAHLLENALGLFEGEEKLEMLFELADVYDDYEEFEKVFDCLRLILLQDPVNEEALYKICFWTDFLGRNEESIQLHQSILEDYPYCELAWFNLAAAYQGLKLYEKAVDAYKYAIAIDEKFDYAYRNMGDAYIRMRSYKEAIECLEKVLELSRPEDVIYEALGHCYDRMKQFGQARFYYRKASHLNKEDSKLQYKIACTYLNESQWASAAKHLDVALSMHQYQPEFNLAMGECKMQMGFYKEAIHYFSIVVRYRTRNTAGWEALIRCLYLGGFMEEALRQVDAALTCTDQKPLFHYYGAAVNFALGRSKEALALLEKGMGKSPRMLRKMLDLNPSLLQNSQVVDLLARYKRKRSL